MQYAKPATSIDEQVARLLERGMVCRDEQLVKRWLTTVGYYRLSAYWLPYEVAPNGTQTRSKQFAPGTEFETITDIYTFDRQLRLLVMEAVERIEIALRTSWTYHLAHASGPHAHMLAELFDSSDDHNQYLQKLKESIDRSKEVFITHYLDRYSDPSLPPLWAVTELMTFSELSKWIAFTTDRKIGSAIAKDVGLPTRETLSGAIQAISFVRNICAHHGRLWNRQLVKRIPNIKRFKADLSIEVNGQQAQPDNRVYNILVLLARLVVHQSHDSTFPGRLMALVESRARPQQEAMGFPQDWKQRPIWAPFRSE